MFPGSKVNNTEVYNQQLSPDRSHVLVEGTFTKVQGNRRQQIFMLNLSGHGNVSTWYSNDFNQFCANKHPFYIKSAAWSADQSTVYLADTGNAPEAGTAPSRSPGCVTRSRPSRPPRTRG